MKLVDALDRALGLKTSLFIVSEATENFLPRNVWSTMDTDLLAKLAFTKSRNARNLALQSLVGKFDKTGGNMIYQPGEEDNERLAQIVARAIEGKASEQDEEELAGTRKEARAWANERGVTSKAAPVSDPLAMTPSAYEKARETFSARGSKVDPNAPKKEYYGDKLWRIEDSDGNVVRDEFSDEGEAERNIQTLPGDADQYKIVQYANPWSLSALNTVVKPLENGWTADRVVSAMKPMVRYFANKYWSAKVGIEDLMQDGYVGVLRALNTDKGIAPFGKYAPQKIKNEILRAALQKGLIRGPEGKGEGGSFGEKGPIVSYDVVWRDANGELASKSFQADISAFKDYHSEQGISPPLRLDPNYVKAQEFKKGLLAQGLKPVANGILVTRRKMGSLDKPLIGKEGEASGGEYIRGKISTPAHLAATKNMISHLLNTSKLSERQKEAIKLTFAMDVPEGSMGYWPEPRTGQPAEPENVTAAAEPVKVQGMADRSIVNTSANFEKGSKKGFTIERGPVEIAKMMGISTEAARKHLQTGLDKLYLTAQKEQMDLETIEDLLDAKEEAASEADKVTQNRIKKSTADIPAMKGQEPGVFGGNYQGAETTTPSWYAKESLDRLMDLILFEETCRSMILELAFTGRLVLG